MNRDIQPAPMEPDPPSKPSTSLKPRKVPKPTPYDHPPRLHGNHRLHEVCDIPVDVRTLVSGDTLELEVGPGRGGFVFERIETAKDIGFMGLEVRRKWATIVDARIAKLGLSARARVFAEDAKLAMPRMQPDGVFSVIYLHFPDPWWKKKHTKRLVMGDEFMTHVVRLLKTGGALFVQTDVEERAALYCDHIKNVPGLVPDGDNGTPWLAENPYGARSPREHRAVADGLPVHRMRFRKA
jgi:tRNA (guanine-N7-)-methyltransferase